MVDGFDSYWLATATTINHVMSTICMYVDGRSFSRHKKGYSGTATYVRKGIVRAACEGFGVQEFNQEVGTTLTSSIDMFLFAHQLMI